MPGCAWRAFLYLILGLGWCGGTALCAGLQARADEPPSTEPAAAASPAAEAEAGSPPRELTNSIGMKLRLIPAGQFVMGTNQTEAEVEREIGVPYKGFSVDDERPEHLVTLTKPYYIGVYEVSVTDFRQFVNDTDYRTECERNGRGGWGWGYRTRGDEQHTDFAWNHWGVNQSDTSPVTNVSWNDAVAFCQWLSDKEGRRYRLPTEAEWECACRAGTSTHFYGGYRPLDAYRLGNLSDLTEREFRGIQRVGNSEGKPTGEMSRYPEGARDGYAFTSPAGKFRPNAFGLFDMLGNAAEWCNDWYAADYYRHSPEKDPPGPATGTKRVIRGGHFSALPFDCRSSCRRGQRPDLAIHLLGFRVACDAAAPEVPTPASDEAAN